MFFTISHMIISIKQLKILVFVQMMIDGIRGAFAAFVAVLSFAVTRFNFPEVDPSLRPINIPTSMLNQSYDFIIVGAGSAGNYQMHQSNYIYSILPPSFF